MQGTIDKPLRVSRLDRTANQVDLGFPSRSLGQATMFLDKDAHRADLMKRGVGRWESLTIHDPMPQSCSALVVTPTLRRIETARLLSNLFLNLLLDLLMRLEGPLERCLHAVCGVSLSQKSPFEKPRRPKGRTTHMESFVATVVTPHHRKARLHMVVLVLKTWFVDGV